MTTEECLAEMTELNSAITNDKYIKDIKYLLSEVKYIKEENNIKDIYYKCNELRKKIEELIEKYEERKE